MLTIYSLFFTAFLDQMLLSLNDDNLATLFSNVLIAMFETETKKKTQYQNFYKQLYFSAITFCFSSASLCSTLP